MTSWGEIGVPKKRTGRPTRSTRKLAPVIPITDGLSVERDPYARKVVEAELERLDNLEIDGWDGEPWDATTYAVACRLIEIGNACSWTGYELDELHEMFLEHAPSDDRFGERQHEAKWRSAENTVGDNEAEEPDRGDVEEVDVSELLTAPTADTTDEDVGGCTVGEVSLDDLLGATITDLATKAPARQRTTWWPVPVDQAAKEYGERPSPTVLRRDDGQGLLYRHRVNMVIGESGSGKSMIALWAMAEVLKSSSDARCLYLDFEDSPDNIAERLELMGCDADQVARADYAHPDESLAKAEARDFREALAAHDYEVIVVDGINAAMYLFELDINSTNDGNAFSQRLLRPLQETGACVIGVDHVAKNPESRGKGAIGTQAKRSMLTGAELVVDVIDGFGRGVSGKVKLTLDKDRVGFLPKVCEPVRDRPNVYVAATVCVDSTDDSIELQIEAPERTASTASGASPTSHLDTATMRKISKCLEAAPDGLSMSQIRDAVPGRNAAIKEATDRLVMLGFAERAQRKGRGGGLLIRSLRPYYGETEMTSDRKAQVRAEHDLARAQQVADLEPAPTTEEARDEQD